MGPKPEYPCSKTAPDDDLIKRCIRLIEEGRDLAAVRCVVLALQDTPANRAHIASVVRLVMDILIGERDWRIAGMVYVKYRGFLPARMQEEYEQALQDITPWKPVAVETKKERTFIRRYRKRAA
jgi:hypothetical protein